MTPRGGMMRHPAYVQVGGRDVTVTNRDKVFFPRSGMTKGDLVDYYVAVAPAVLPHVRERVMQMLRYPNGVDGAFFYQKRVPVPHPEWLETYTIEFPSGRTADFPVVNDAAALAWIANLGCIDLHTWSSRIGDVEKPDYLLIDLDPRGGDPWSHVRTIALVVKDVMDELGLASWPKTSGSTGIHILAPIVPELPFPEVRRFAKAFAQEVERRVPDIATTTWKVADRTGVFARPHDRVGLLDPPDPGCARVRAVALGRGRRRRGRGLHHADDARAHREGRRPHGRDVGDAVEPRAALRAAQAQAREDVARRPEIVGSPARRDGRTCAHVHCFGSLSGRKRRKRVP